MTTGTHIRASSVLPARREPIELHTADGLRLVGELALPLDRDPVATMVTLHPLPTHGGFMDSHVFRKAAYRLPALAGLAVLRFNLRGVSSPRRSARGPPSRRRPPPRWSPTVARGRTGPADRASSGGAPGQRPA